MGSLASDAKYRVVPNLPCPTCYQGHVETVIKIPHGYNKSPELVYAHCDPHECNFNKDQRVKLLERAMEYVDEYEKEKTRRLRK